MKWRYEIEYMDGETETFESRREVHRDQSADRNLIVYVNEHGHDRRWDEVVIPLENVRKYRRVEVQ